MAKTRGQAVSLGSDAPVADPVSEAPVVVQPDADSLLSVKQAPKTANRAPTPVVRPFKILNCDANSNGSVTVSFSALKNDQPTFWFENSLGDVFPIAPSGLQSSGMSGINLLSAIDAYPGWALTEVGGGAKLGKNINVIWTLADVDTFYVTSGPGEDVDAPKPSAVLSDPITGGRTPIQPSKEYYFSILAGVHRCTARIEIECLSSAGETLSKESKNVDMAFLGGEFESGYDRVTINFKSPEGAASVKVSVFKGPTTQSEAGFVFFAKPCLVALPMAAEVNIVSRSMLELLTLNPGLEIFSTGLPVPEELLRGRRDPVAVAIEINGETRRVEGFELRWNNAVRIDACWIENRDVLFRGVKAPDNYDDVNIGIFIDGELSVEGTITDLGNFEGRLSMSARHLDGRPHAIEIRLLEGQFCLARTFGIVSSYLTPWEALQEYAKGPFSLSASPAAIHHFRSYKSWTENAKTRELPNLRFLGDELLQGFKKRTTYPAISFSRIDKPKVSVVIPVHNKMEVTYFCLCSLLFAYNAASFEVIITDDGSTDATQNIQDFVSGISVVRHPAALGFVDSCNDGAAIARGEYIFFLNNDTEVTAGSIDELLKVFADFNNVGLAGSKLLYPNGKLQEAGGIVWRTGNPWNVGRNGNANEPQFSYLRQADYISGAAVLIPRKVWDEVGGFSAELAPAYFEDTDLAMKVRDTGRFVVFVPNSVIFHYEGQSAGTSTASGMKRFQEVNRPKFKRKWAKLYSRNGVEGVRPDLEKDRNIAIRILMLDHAFPHVDSDAGSYAAFQEIRLLQSLGAKITFIPRNLAWMDRHTAALENIGVECLYAPFVMDIENYIREHAADYDVFYITRFRIADEFVSLIRRYAPAAKIILNLADLHFLREMREAAAGSANYSFERAHDTRDAELRTIGSVDLTLTYTDVESTVIQSHVMGTAKVAKVPWVVEVNENPRPKFSETKDILFLGGFAHDPNREAVKFFARSVMPRVREILPDVRFRIAGSRPPADVLALESDSVEIVGFVRDLDALFASTRVYVAPLLAGAGIKGKVIEGMAQGMAMVVSAVAAEGTGLATGFDCFVAKTINEWVEGVVKLYTDEALWTSVGDAAKEGARRRFSFGTGQDMMRDVLGMVEIFAPATGLYYKRARP